MVFMPEQNNLPIKPGTIELRENDGCNRAVFQDRRHSFTADANAFNCEVVLDPVLRKYNGADGRQVFQIGFVISVAQCCSSYIQKRYRMKSRLRLTFDCLYCGFASHIFSQDPHKIT